MLVHAYDKDYWKAHLYNTTFHPLVHPKAELWPIDDIKNYY